MSALPSASPVPSEDFTVIDETKVIEVKRVRLVPHQNAGILSLLRIGQTDYFVEWEEQDSGEEHRINLANISSMIPDEGSSTLLILTKGQGTWLFHFLSGSPMVFLDRVQVKLEAAPSETGPFTQHQLPSQSSFDDPGFAILNTFAKVKQFYARTACRVLGMEQKERPARKTTGPPKNPWIVEPKYDFPPPRRLRTKVTRLIWKSFHEADGSLIDRYDALHQLLHQSGASDEVRPEAWKYIFALRTPSMTDDQYQVHLEELQGEFQRILELLEFMVVPEEVSQRIDKDVFRTDRTMDFYHPNPRTMEEDLKLENLRRLQQLLLAYYAYDPELEYVQGMADLLSPILYVLRDETETFWAFVHLLKRQRENFVLNGTAIERKMSQIRELLRLIDPHFYDYLGFQGDSAQLFFCYRWILILFKREFAFEDTLLVWESIMTAPESPWPYEVFISVAILLITKESIQENCSGFGETLAHLSSLTHALDVQSVLEKADQLYRLVSEDKRLSWLYNNAIHSSKD